MKQLLAVFLCILALGVNAKVVSSITHPRTEEVIFFHDEQKDCPDKALYATYRHPGLEITASGCYMMDGEVVVVIFRDGPYAGQPLFLSVKGIKPSI